MLKKRWSIFDVKEDNELESVGTQAHLLRSQAQGWLTTPPSDGRTPPRAASPRPTTMSQRRVLNP